MLGYYVRRLSQAVITIWASITLSFFIIHEMPGSPQEYLASRFASMSGMSQDEINRMVSLYLSLDQDKPLHEQYLGYMGDIVFHFDFGRSVAFRRPVGDVIIQALPWTIFISTVAITFGTVLFLVIGSFLATKEGSRWDVGGSYFVMFSDSIPYYVVALLLLFYLGFVTQLFPQRGLMEPGTTPGFNVEFMRGVLYHAALPILSFAVTAWGGLSFRAHCTRILGEDYIRVGKLRGLRDSRIMTRYVAWNSLLPMYTGIMAGMAAIFGGSIIMENIFTYPGMGFYMWRAIQFRDYPLMLGGLIIFTVVTVLALLVADLTYGWLDPRVSSRDVATYGSNLSSVLRNLVRRVRGLVRNRGERVELEPLDLSGLSHLQDSTETGATDGGSASTGDATTGSGGGSQTLSNREYYYTVLDRKILTPWRVLWSAPRARVGLLIVGFYLFVGFVAPAFVAEPFSFQADPGLSPFQDLAHPLGSDNIGVDLVSQAVYSTVPMLKMMFAGAIFASVVGTIVGIAAGYFGGAIDRLLTTMTDIMINIPGIPLVIVLAAIYGSASPVVIGVILAIDDWPGLARGLRSEVLTLREREYVEAGRVMGLNASTIFRQKVLRSLMPLITINTVRAARNIIFASAGLYFLGVLPYSTLNWGVWMNNARQAGALTNPEQFYLLAIPLLLIITLSLGLLLFSQGTDRLYNPRLRARHAKTVADDSTEGSR